MTTDPNELFAEYLGAIERGGEDRAAGLGILGAIDPNHPGGTMEDAARNLQAMLGGYGAGKTEQHRQALAEGASELRPLRDLT
jgi:hypothetical protein